MYLSGPQIKEYVEALGHSFTPDRLDELLLGRLDKERDMISLAGDYKARLYDVVIAANKEGWALKLLTAARASNPSNPQLLTFEEFLGLGTISADERPSLEKIVNERSKFHDAMDFRSRLGLLETWVCAFEFPGGGGTGFLVGPDLVLTNYHVIEDILKGNAAPTDVRCRFDYKALVGGLTVNPGTAVAMSKEWDIVHSPYSDADTAEAGGQWSPDELDFAIVRLDREIGSEPIGVSAERQAPNRGWLALPAKPAGLTKGDVVFVLQHPQDLESNGVQLQPIQLATGTVLGFVGNGLRMRHDARTLPGSSGSPVFNADLELTALHHAGEPNNRLDYRGAYNQAIPLGEISRFLAAKNFNAMLSS